LIFNKIRSLKKHQAPHQEEEEEEEERFNQS
jgi:hypothetical protein